MVAGGGASVIYSDTICDLGGANELANYGEYSGAPSEQQTYEYAKTILNLMTSSPKHPEGKVLITGGGIANFTNVAATFRGIITALREFQPKLVEHNVSIFVRRAGPNYQEGLRKMREFGSTLGIPLHVFGPETHMTAICGMALGKRPIPTATNAEFSTANFLLPGGQNAQPELRQLTGDCANGKLGKETTITIVVIYFFLRIISDDKKRFHAKTNAILETAYGYIDGLKYVERVYLHNRDCYILWWGKDAYVFQKKKKKIRSSPLQF